VGACASSSPHTAPPAGGAKSSRAEPTVDEVFDPAEHGADDVRAAAEDVIGRIVPPEAEPAVQEPESAQDGRDTTWISLEGYRVQIFASLSRPQAEMAAQRAREAFPDDSVYIVFQTPWHKVRIGDFRTREEADAKLAEARSKGYDALWVRSRIRVMRRQDG